MDEELEQAQKVYDLVVNYLVEYSFQIFAAVVILIVGIYIAGKVAAMILKLMLSKEIDITLSHFSASVIKGIVIVMISIVALGKLGISVTPFVAAIGALSLGAGLALQGLLSNYGAGISIIVTRPFVIGDTINVQGISGIVKEIHLAYTLLYNEDEVEITIPNRHIVGEIIQNSHADSMVEIGVGIAYDSDTERAISAVQTSLKSIQGISEAREPLVGIDNFGDSSINIGVRFWAKTEVLFQTKYKANSAIFKALADENINIPFPQRHVHLFNNDSEQGS